ncbi:unnamed protein product [Spirodela intermedia]|uniref:3-oxo-5-alpha-steroid 4-dehydrogenase C-terminal domain-containing protein n=1 Tax=Spirodela intermedia TaxID=51605 RepID=A0A7I8JVK1_SPIIN|nr:unnamed protein product [Spirodela intermedia]CAA6673482.1 unnamed protein product [Spirodela intermedia]
MDADVDSTGQLWKTVFVLILMEAQVIRRLYESFFVFKYDSSARMHVLGYLTGLVFYVAEPVSLCCSFALEALTYTGTQISEYAVKGWQGIPEAEFDLWDYMMPLTNVGWLQWIGAVIFFWVGSISSTVTKFWLGSLRKQRRADEYLIPHGDWFEVASCGHYLAEIVMYLGIVLVSSGTDLTLWLLLAFVVANLVFAAAETHQWYLQKFDNYPRTRRVIIPLLY